jgi:hypothetical protein
LSSFNTPLKQFLGFSEIKKNEINKNFFSLRSRQGYFRLRSTMPHPHFILRRAEKDPAPNRVPGLWVVHMVLFPWRI